MLSIFAKNKSYNTLPADDVVGILVNERQFLDMQTGIDYLRMENDNLRKVIGKLKHNLLGYVLEAGNLQDIEPPGELDDYPFSDN